jgi:hypothetical protein
MEVILDRQTPELVVLHELNLDQVPGNEREPAGQEYENPDGAGAVLHG